MKEYNVKVTIRNNLLLNALKEAGYETQSDFARAAGLRVTEVNSLVGLRKAPILQSGEFSPVAKEVMEVLGACPTDLWTPEQLTMELKNNSSSFNVEYKDLESLALSGRGMSGEITNDPVEVVNKKLIADHVDKTLKTLTFKEQQVICKRFGIREDVMQLEEIGKTMGLTKERVRQIEAKALRKLRNPERGLWEIAYPTSQEEKIISEKIAQGYADRAIEKMQNAAEERHRLMQIYNKKAYVEGDESWLDYVKREDPELFEKMRNRIEEIVQDNNE
jgi:RNA polymerase sigma factor (sigma-70 family)